MVAITFLLLCVVTMGLTDDIVSKLDPGPRYQYMPGPDGRQHLVDLWVKTRNVNEAAKYNPDVQNAYHLFTRQNPTTSQPMVLGNEALVSSSNYDVGKTTIVLVHGWMSDPYSTINRVLVPGEGVARFISWLCGITGTSLTQFHLTGHSLGGHQVGVIGRNLGGVVPYIMSLDPAGPGWLTNDNRFQPNDGLYTEVIHTNVGVMGYLPALGKVDFYPNGGVNMPGCTEPKCDHDRSLYYFAESLTSQFTGRRCLTYLNALTGSCFLTQTLNMGGLEPKTGNSGIYYTETNAAPPFSKD
ncbi:pancreatic lipase-related protein 2-like isoform X3 [Anticarsia gemmatalis]|uniref:pancreatic lipase-related protein 2-like isoform X3 n=1 Tax=Anticarsia gemmatalis TaxID=129554 RepID=UPI003F7676F3